MERTAEGLAAVGDSIQLGGYVATRLLARGGMGTVYEGRHLALGRRVALKVINQSLVGDPVAAERFSREAHAVARIAHPHVVDVFDMGLEGDRPYLVMELLEGETLEALLLREERLAVSRAISILLPVISAAAAIHDSGLVHRDLKPSNIMLARRGPFVVDPVVLDFGISRPKDAAAASGLTDPDVMVGTLPYLSPEQMRDATSASPLSDQYACGVMLYECLTGRRPFIGGDRYELMHAVMSSPLPPPSSRVPGVSATLDEIVMRAMSRRPAARFPSMRALGSALLASAEPGAWRQWAPEFIGRADAGPGAGETEHDARGLPTGGRQRLPWAFKAPPRLVLAVAAGAVLSTIGLFAVASRARLHPAPATISLLPRPATPPNAPGLPAQSPPQALAPTTSPVPAPFVPDRSRRRRGRLPSLARPAAAPTPPASGSPPDEGPPPSKRLDDDSVVDPFAPLP